MPHAEKTFLFLLSLQKIFFVVSDWEREFRFLFFLSFLFFLVVNPRYRDLAWLSKPSLSSKSGTIALSRIILLLPLDTSFVILCIAYSKTGRLYSQWLC